MSEEQGRLLREVRWWVCGHLPALGPSHFAPDTLEASTLHPSPLPPAKPQALAQMQLQSWELGAPPAHLQVWAFCGPRSNPQHYEAWSQGGNPHLGCSARPGLRAALLALS